MENGYRPSHSQRLEDRTMKKTCSELSRLRKELKLLKEDPLSVMCSAANRPQPIAGVADSTRSAQIKETLAEVEKVCFPFYFLSILDLTSFVSLYQ